MGGGDKGIKRETLQVIAGNSSKCADPQYQVETIRPLEIKKLFGPFVTSLRLGA